MTGNSNYLLDTNIIIEVFDNNMEIVDKLNKVGRFCISSVVLGELYIGINRVANREKHQKKIELFSHSVRSVNC